jgi:hypothetical protein
MDRTENSLQCRAPALDAFSAATRNTAGGFAVTVNVAVKNQHGSVLTSVSKFGELFVYK